jgi:hypothetical protein
MNATRDFDERNVALIAAAIVWSEAEHDLARAIVRRDDTVKFARKAASLAAAKLHDAVAAWKAPRKATI